MAARCAVDDSVRTRRRIFHVSVSYTALTFGIIELTDSPLMTPERMTVDISSLISPDKPHTRSLSTSPSSPNRLITYLTTYSLMRSNCALDTDTPNALLTSEIVA